MDEAERTVEAGLVAAIGTEASCLMQFNFLQKKNADRPKDRNIFRSTDLTLGGGGLHHHHGP